MNHSLYISLLVLCVRIRWYRAWAPRWHTPGGCHLHLDIRHFYTFHRWIEVEMKTFLASKSTAKTHLEKYFVYLFCGYFQTFLFCFSLTWQVRCTLASMKKRFQFSLKSTQIHSILLQISTASPFFSKITPPAV